MKEFENYSKVVYIGSDGRSDVRGWRLAALPEGGAVLYIPEHDRALMPLALRSQAFMDEGVLTVRSHDYFRYEHWLSPIKAGPHLPSGTTVRVRMWGEIWDAWFVCPDRSDPQGYCVVEIPEHVSKEFVYGVEQYATIDSEHHAYLVAVSYDQVNVESWRDDL